MVTEFALEILLKIIKLARSTYYYQLKQLDKSDKNHDIKDEIQAIFTEHKGNYGYRRMTLELRNRGVRYLFEAKESDAGDFKYVQFSDHEITPVKAAHFHIFHGGKSQEALYDELENWPTYYPSNLSGLEVAQEMLAH